MSIKIPREKTFDRVLNKVQDNIAGAIEKLFLATTGSFQLSLIGCTTVPVAMANYQLATNAGQVTISLPTLKAISNVDTASLVGLPAVLWPKTQQTIVAIMTDNGISFFGPISIQINGVMSLATTADAGGGTGFTTSGIKGVNGQFNITYVLGF